MPILMLFAMETLARWGMRSLDTSPQGFETDTDSMFGMVSGERVGVAQNSSRATSRLEDSGTLADTARAAVVNVDDTAQLICGGGSEVVSRALVYPHIHTDLEG
jgi:hypothetical protein